MLITAPVMPLGRAHRADARVERAPVVAAARHLQVDRFAGLQHLGQRGENARPVFGHGDFIEPPADDALARMRANAAIDELHAPVGVDQDQPVAGAGGHDLQQFLRCAQLLLGARLLADVDGDADDAHHLARGVSHHAGRIQQRDVVTVAMPDAVLERDHGFGAAIEPLLEQRLVIRMHERRPVGRARQLGAGITQHAFVTFAGGQAGLRVDLVDHAAQFARHGPEPLVGGREPGLADLARGDVDHQAEHPAGGAVGRAVHDIGAIERPVPAAIGVAKAIFGLEHLRRGVDVQQAFAESLDLPVRVGAEQRAPGLDVGAAKGGVDAEHAVIAVGVIGEIVLDVPVPDAGGS